MRLMPLGGGALLASPFAFRLTLDADAPPVYTPQISTRFDPQALLAGGHESVFAGFWSGVAFSPSEVQFTLYDTDAPAAGYDGITAGYVSALQGRVARTSVLIDLTPDAPHPLAPGEYRAEFMLTTTSGQDVIAAGKITVLSPITGADE